MKLSEQSLEASAVAFDRFWQQVKLKIRLSIAINILLKYFYLFI
jgi:hypothetical protein